MTNGITYGAVLRVPVHLLRMDQVRRDLYVVNKTTADKRSMGLKLSKSDYLGVDLFWEQDGFVHLPRGYKPPWKGPDPLDSPNGIDCVLPVPEKASMPPFRLKLRKWQLPVTEALMGSNRCDKILCLGCGKGKTICALWYAARINERTLILVDRDFLLDQWVQRIKQAFWLHPNRISVIKGAKKPFEADFTVAMVQTFVRRDWSEEWLGQFGLIIADEVDVLGAPSYQEAISLLPGERLGLTATVDRKDGMDPVFRLHMGGMKPIYTDLSRFQSGTWVFRRVPRCISEREESKCKTWLPAARKRVINRAKLDTALEVNKLWNDAIIKDIKAAAKAGRRCIVLGTRVRQLRILETHLKDLGVGFVDADVKGVERAKAFRQPVILATMRLASRALDVPSLDTLFLLYPSTDEGFLRQALGRIDRPAEGKFKPMVLIYSHDYIDTLARKEDEMMGTIRQIDPKGTIEASQVRF